MSDREALFHIGRRKKGIGRKTVDKMGMARSIQSGGCARHGIPPTGPCGATPCPRPRRSCGGMVGVAEYTPCCCESPGGVEMLIEFIKVKEANGQTIVKFAGDGHNYYTNQEKILALLMAVYMAGQEIKEVEWDDPAPP